MVRYSKGPPSVNEKGFTAFAGRRRAKSISSPVISSISTTPVLVTSTTPSNINANPTNATEIASAPGVVLTSLAPGQTQT